MGNVEYLVRLSRWAPARHDVSEIRAAIDSAGFWERHDEWRMSTVTSKRIERAELQGRKGFLVTAKCDHEFTCHSPTLERAVEMLGVYDQLIVDLFWTLGWPSWAKKGQLDP
jgi:hypothetical protein